MDCCNKLTANCVTVVVCVTAQAQTDRIEQACLNLLPYSYVRESVFL